jgi:hypothetical protein
MGTSQKKEGESKIKKNTKLISCLLKVENILKAKEENGSKSSFGADTLGKSM